MKKAKTVLGACLASALVLVPQYGLILPERFKWYAYGVLFIYEAGARLLPTVRNVSLISQFIKLTQLVLPNNSKDGTHE